mmetsp:Transcript_1921/g.5716  ORF Transcript_1921/g.5716 Transcript_1921/m.5716 type:complete len:279 (+) Transcript_1921:93-929(+)
MPALNIIHPGLRVFMQDDQEPAVPGTTTPASVGTATASGGRSSIERNSEDDIGSGGKASGRGRKRVGLTAGGAGATRKELAEMPSARQKRILANRQSAARSKERKLAYISELEAQVSALTVQLTSASLQLRSLQQDTTSLGECNAALAQQALVLREHMAQRDAETSALADELRRAQAILAAHNLNVNGSGSGGSTALSSAGQTNTVSAPPGGTFGRDELDDRGQQPGGTDRGASDQQRAQLEVRHWRSVMGSTTRGRVELLSWTASWMHAPCLLRTHV